MTALAEASDPFEWIRRLFEFDLDTLAGAGVQPAPEQVHLFEQYVDGGEEGLAMCISTLGDQYSGSDSPVVAWDESIDGPTLIVFPEIVRLGGDWGDVPRSGYRCAPMTFPSLLGSKQVCSPWWGEDEAELDTHRIWTLWPIDRAQATEIVEATCDWRETDERLLMYYDFLSVNCGDHDVCDLAETMGLGERDEHEHRDDSPPGSKYRMEYCVTGEQAWEEFQDEVLIEVPDPDDPEEPWRYFRAFTGPTLPESVQSDWQRLLLASETVSMQLPNLVPPWEREDFIKKERWYSPWLWLC